MKRGDWTHMYVGECCVCIYMQICGEMETYEYTGDCANMYTGDCFCVFASGRDRSPCWNVLTQRGHAYNLAL